MKEMEINPLAYRLGGLLYMPAFQENIVEKVEKGTIPHLSSIAFCLEDSIQDHALQQAEQTLKQTLRALLERNLPEGRRPLLFIRVRTPDQMRRLCREYEEAGDLLTGFILPKFDLRNGERYLAAIEDIHRESRRAVYIMPILETRMVADAATRIPVLSELRRMLDGVRPWVLNVRVGANDFGNLYGLRRSPRQTVYDIGVIRDILMDILNLFARDYVVSAPVWNYFGAPGGAWAEGLERELELDRANGFLGKTAIHPVQLPLIARSLSVSREDYEDACALLDWQPGRSGVAKSVRGGRMNELKCHGNWAKRIKALGDIYGTREDT